MSWAGGVKNKIVYGSNGTYELSTDELSTEWGWVQEGLVGRHGFAVGGLGIWLLNLKISATANKII